MNRSTEKQANAKHGRSLSHLLGIIPALAGVVLALTGAPQAQAASATANGTISANIGSAASLTLSSANVTFSSANPDTIPSVPPDEGDITVTVRTRTFRLWAAALTVKASDDLKAGSEVIGIDKVTWTTAGSGFFAGTMNKVVDQAVGAWVGPGTRSGTVAYRFANSYAYATGSYTAGITYTLTVP